MLTAAGRRPLAAGVALALVGAALFAVAVGARPPGTEWMAALLAAIFGITLTASAPAGDGLYAGVAARVAQDQRLAWLIRAAVIVTGPLCGAGALVYAGVALAQTLAPNPRAAAAIDWRRTTGTGFLGLAAVLAAGAAGCSAGPPTVRWSIMLTAAGLALFWGAGGIHRDSDQDDLDAFLRTGLGLLLAVGGVVLVLSRTLRLDHAGPTVAGTATSLAVLALVGGPRWLRTRRLLGAERIERARAQERAEMADHLHDSVLQTLALIQRRADEPANVAALAHRQERELRDWLLGRRPRLDAAAFADALRAVVADVEDAQGTTFELVIVGDAAIDGGGQALLGAVREALVNAARHAPDAPVSVFAKVDEDTITVYVRDRGPGFDLEAIPVQRRGIRESIVGRMLRHGGTGTVFTAPGEGCEVILSLPRR